LADGEWPRRAELQRLVVRRSEDPPALSEIFDFFPRPLGFVQAPDQRVVLTLAGLQMTRTGRDLTEAFAAVVRLAVERYRSDETPAINRTDLREALGLSPQFEGLISEIVLREAPFVRAGQGGLPDEWDRVVTEDIVRYWNCRTAEDYLARRAQELSQSPQFGWTPSGEQEASTAGSDVSAAVADVSPQLRRVGPPEAVRVAVWAMLALSSLLPLLLGSPLPVSVAVICAGVAAGWVWRRGFVWPPRARAVLMVVVCAAAVGLITFVATRDDDGQAPAEPAATPRSHAEIVTDEYVQTTRHAVEWTRSPTIYEPSVAFFRSHFDWFDPARPHRYDLSRIQARADIPSLAIRGPEIAGAMVDVVGTLAQMPTQITVYNRTTNWAFFLKQPKTGRLLAVCRVPLKTGEEAGYEVGDVIHAVGVLLADGSIQRLDGNGEDRLSYLACSSIARRQAMITIVGRKARKP
jgi:hypothetical protein